ncbi:hypothetical protein QT972_33425, partial [Microcoleus sp. herbarium7]
LAKGGNKNTVISFKIGISMQARCDRTFQSSIKNQRASTTGQKSLSRVMRSPLLASKTKKCTGKSLHQLRLSS